MLQFKSFLKQDTNVIRYIHFRSIVNWKLYSISTLIKRLILHIGNRYRTFCIFTCEIATFRCTVYPFASLSGKPVKTTLKNWIGFTAFRLLRIAALLHCILFHLALDFYYFAFPTFSSIFSSIFPLRLKVQNDPFITLTAWSSLVCVSTPIIPLSSRLLMSTTVSVLLPNPVPNNLPALVVCGTHFHSTCVQFWLNTVFWTETKNEEEPHLTPNIFYSSNAIIRRTHGFVYTAQAGPSATCYLNVKWWFI